MEEAQLLTADPNRPKSDRKGPTAKYQEEIVRLKDELARQHGKHVKTEKATATLLG
jgi:hypothetical protein